MNLTFREGANELALMKLAKGFLFIPVCIALLGGLLTPVALYIDSSELLSGAFEAISYNPIGVDGARAVLSTIAGAMMSVISLVYSLTLIVFTLAAGNISPRLLENFASNRITQITIGLLGATFLYSLLVLFAVDDTHGVRFSVSLAIFLAAASFFWLVYFVNDVANRIRIDAEIGRIQASLRSAIDRLLASEPAKKPNDRDEIPDNPVQKVLTEESGYITFIDSSRLINYAESLDGFIEVLVQPGTFVVEGLPIAELQTDKDDPDLSELHLSFQIGKARAPEGDLQFSIHLMVEIALRALSPGLNDSYTAISAIDHLSASFARILQREAPSSLLYDDNEVPRLWLSLLSVREILDAAVNPLRQSAVTNVLVLGHLIVALERVARVCRPEHIPLIKHQLESIASDARLMIRSKPDRAQIAASLRSALQTCRENSAD